MRRRFRAAGFVVMVAAIAAVDLQAAQGADLGGGCCADLEERIAELEVTTARKGNRKVTLTITGYVTKQIMFWDDGTESQRLHLGHWPDAGDELPADRRGGHRARLEGRLSNAHPGSYRQFHGPEPVRQ